MDKDKNTAQADEEASVDEEINTEDPSPEEKSSSTGEIDYEAELEMEKKRGVPDPLIAKEAFKKRQQKREEEEDEEEDEEKPLTRKEFEKALAKERQTAFKQAQADRI